MMDCLEESTASPNSESNRLSRIKKARAKLVNEEHRLALMKKIRQSQTRPIQQSTTPAATATNQNATSSSSGNNNNNINSQMSSMTSNLSQMNSPHSHQHQFKKLRTSQTSIGSSSSSPNTTVSASATQSSNNFTNTSNADNPAAAAAAAAAQMVSRALQKNSPNSVGLNLSALAGLNTTISGAISTPPGSQSQLNQTPAHAHQRPKVNNLWNPPQQRIHPTPVGIAPPHVGNMSRNPITTPPNVVQAMISNLVGQQQSLLNNPINNLTNITSNNINATTSSSKSGRRNNTSQQLANSFANNKSPSSAQLLMQNQQQRTSSKTSLQKQIEQTLLQQNSKLGLNNFTGSASIQQQSSNKRSSTSSSSSAIVSPHVGNLTRQPITTPPNVVQDMRGNLSGQQSLLMNSNNSTTSSGSRRTNQQSQQQAQMQNLIGSQFSKPQAAQLLLQKRSAAKLAIQKQLEQTLTQLPPQKQIQLGIDFLPNANMEFCYALGLEACVDYLTKTKSPVEAPVAEKPNVCSTCGSDFTPSWSWKRSQVMCENCVGSNLRKSIKSSHASRIKSVLAKASKQEQDIDQKIMAEAANVVSSASSPGLSSSPLTTSSIINNNNNNSNIPNNNNQANQHSLLQHPTPGRNSNNNNQSAWNSTTPTTTSRTNHNAILANSRQNSANNNTTSTLPNSTNVQPNLAAAAATGLNPANLLSNLPPAVLASLLQMNQMPSVGANTNNQPNNQLAQMAQLLMNQLTMNLMRR